MEHNAQTCHFCQSLRLAVATLESALPGTAQLMGWSGYHCNEVVGMLRDFITAMEKLEG